MPPMISLVLLALVATRSFSTKDISTACFHSKYKVKIFIEKTVGLIELHVYMISNSKKIKLQK